MLSSYTAAVSAAAAASVLPTLYTGERKISYIYSDRTTRIYRVDFFFFFLSTRSGVATKDDLLQPAPGLIGFLFFRSSSFPANRHGTDVDISGQGCVATAMEKGEIILRVLFVPLRLANKQCERERQKRVVSETC